MPCVLITGSSRRIGKGLAIEFASKGWDVAVHYNSSSEAAVEVCNQIKSLGRKTIAIQSDLKEKKEIENLYNEAFNFFGNIDVVVNNAGIFPEETKLADIDEKLWQGALDLNLNSIFYGSQIFAKNAKPDSRIINIGSLGAYKIWKHKIPYNVSKAALIQLTKALARELAPDISVNCVAPGIIEIPEDETGRIPKISPDKIPMKRFGKISDIFDAVYFFSTATRYITGQVLIVDGGYQFIR